jgi:calpain-15
MDASEFAPLKAKCEAQLRDMGKHMVSMGITVEQLHTSEGIRQKIQQVNASMPNGTQQNLSFLDVSFPPCDGALYEPGTQPNNPPPIIWRRPKDFLKDDAKDGKIQLYSDGIHASDIKQGALGDCWFLAALAALTEFHSTVEELLSNCVVNDDGVYEVVCWKNGKQTSVIIDDWFPCNPTTGKPVYSHTNGNELWVLILEKAWAKLHGSYQRIEQGIPYQAFMDLLCQPGISFPFDDYKPQIQSGEFYKMLKMFTEDGYLMTASTPGKDDMTKAIGKPPTAGIVPGHAYTLKSVHEYNGEKLVCLRNPWGDFEWDGDWSDKSTKWTTQSQEALKYKPNPDDGLFWMDEKDFFAHFNEVQAAHVRAGSGAPWSIALESINCFGGDGWLVSAFQFQVDQNAEGFATLWQLDERQRTSPAYVGLAYAIYGPLSQSGGPMPAEIVRSPCWKRREMVKHIRMNPGRYFACVWNCDATVPSCGGAGASAERPATFMFHLGPVGSGGAKHVELVTEALQPSAEVSRLAAICSVLSGEESEKKDHGDLFVSTGWLPDGGYGLVLGNKTQNELEVQLDFGGTVGLQLSGGRGLKTSVTVPAGQQAVLGAELRPDPSAKQAKAIYKVSRAKK